jgi:hypothetical protein
MKTIAKKRGKKPLKTFKIAPGELKHFPASDKFNLRYRARASGWKISIRHINGKLLVFRES